MTAKPRQKHNPSTSEYEPTARELAALSAFRANKAANSAPRLKVAESGGKTTISLDQPEGAFGHLLLMEAIGTADEDFLNGLLRQIADAGSQDQKVDEERLNFLLSVVKGVKPRDEAEGMLAAQMAAIHMATMTFARRLAHVENIPQQDSAERALNKLARTFATQMETLKRYRTGGEQKVTVQHVSVSEGGQAIVGNVTQASPAGTPDKAAVSPPALVDQKTGPMPRVDTGKERVRISQQRRSTK
jgi:hypothetical protein